MDTRGIASPSGSIVIDASLDSSPLLGSGNASSNGFGDGGRSFSRRGGIASAARFFRRVSNRRMMREPSMLVRETAAEQLEERQSGWAYSRPVVVLDLVWNLAFVIVAIVVLMLSKDERTRTPLRVWVLGYTLQCVLHMVCVLMEYRRRYRQRALASMGSENWTNSVTTHYESDASGENESEDGDDILEHASLAKRLESVNTMFSFVWWIVGFYWIASGGKDLTSESPLLYWLSVVFLAFDVFFVVFCIALACIIGIAVCCCLPCIIAILYAVADQEGASEEDISSLPKYRFRRIGNLDKDNWEKLEPSGGSISLVGHSESPHERILTAEDAECCICLSSYDDDIELHELPCGHHFHCACIDKWLRINATCPLCKYNILKSNNNVREEV